MPAKDKSSAKRLRDLISAGAAIAGGASGAAIGLLAAGPVGTVALGAAGSAVGLAIQRMGQEASNRLLAPGEQARVGGVLALATVQIKDRIDAGESPRDDGFFDKEGNQRSDAEELAESVLLKSQREAQERKLPYMASLISNIAFDDTISPDLAQQITKAAEALTYRQLYILRLAAVDKSNLTIRKSDYRSHGSFSKELYQILFECFDLYNRSFVHFGGSAAFGPTDVNPGSMVLQGVGVDLYQQMGLENIPIAEVIELANALR